MLKTLILDVYLQAKGDTLFNVFILVSHSCILSRRIYQVLYQLRRYFNLRFMAMPTAMLSIALSVHAVSDNCKCTTCN